MKKVTITNEIKEGCEIEIIRGAHKFAPNATVTSIIPVGTKTASQEEQAAAAAAYAAQLDSYKPEEFNILNGKTLWGGYIIRTVLSKKLKSLGFEVLTQPQKKIDRWGEGQPHGYEKYFKGGYAAQIICGSLEESGIVSRDSSLENMFQINCEIRNKTGALGTGYIYVRAGSRSEGKKVVEIFFSEYYGTDIEVSTKTELVEHPGIWPIKDNEAARKAVAAAKKNNGILYTKAAVAELQEQRKLDIMKAELAVRDKRIAALEATVAKLQATVATLLNAPKPEKPEDDPEPEPKDPKPSSEPESAGDEDNWDDDDWETPAHCEDVLMNLNPNAKQETTPEPEEPDVSTSIKEEQAVPEEQSAQEEPVKKEEEPIVLSDEDITLIGSFFKPFNLAEPSKAVLDYDTAMADYVARRIEMYTELVKATRLLGCDIVDLQKAVKKDFRPNGLKIEAIAIKNDKVYVRANKCGRGGRAFYRVVKNKKVEVLQDNFVKISDF